MCEIFQNMDFTEDQTIIKVVVMKYNVLYIINKNKNKLRGL
jgi:hypothetical protein